MKKLANNELLKEISTIKSEIGDLQTLLLNLIKSNDAKEADNIETIIEKIINYYEQSEKLQLELINRNYNSQVVFKDKIYKPIELLKIKETLMMKKILYKTITTEINDFSDKRLLNTSLEAFQEFQTVKSDLNEVYETLEKYNKGN